MFVLSIISWTDNIKLAYVYVVGVTQLHFIKQSTSLFGIKCYLMSKKYITKWSIIGNFHEPKMTFIGLYDVNEKIVVSTSIFFTFIHTQYY